MGTAASTRERDAIHTEMETAAVSSSKRARLGGSDRLSDLPDCLLHDILSLLGCRQAVRTSALSRRWRHLWRSMTCLNIDQREFQRSGVPPPLDVCQWDSFEDMADSLLSTSITTPSAPLDAFRLHLVDGSKKTGVDRWIRRGLARRPAAVDIHYGYGYVGRVCWPDTSRLASGATCRLTRLRLFGVQLSPSFGRDLGDQCPVLEDLHIENCREDFCTVASPTLKSFALVSPSDYSYRSSALVLAVPHLASLRLVLPFSGYRGYAVATSENEVLASLVQASICIKDMDDEVQRNRRVMKPHKLDFLKSMCNFLACIPNVRNLHLSGFTTTRPPDPSSLPPLPCSAAALHRGVPASLLRPPATTLLSAAIGDAARAKLERLGGGGLLLAHQLLKIDAAAPILIFLAVMADNGGWSVAAGL
ncbi:MEIOTIC F-BOX protein MOF-like [Aegilops tauschii subsp. strangulata]|uniref:MEIOTIC F-BOX protein MOF-like n=1 Tax=Aegilops tauschii subsp. strangulata TaxID=200361 RepID=UPI00098BB60E|nr:MEIOTIC F-BOX protein MOF-like [Aegilops tauschii subsp. strangulata]